VTVDGPLLAGQQWLILSGFNNTPARGFGITNFHGQALTQVVIAGGIKVMS
jgi:hypothetical protein